MMLNKKIGLTGGAIAAVMVVSLIVAIDRVSSYGSKASESDASSSSDMNVVAVQSPVVGVDDASVSQLRDRCRKETLTSDGRRLAAAMGEDGIIALCLETAQVLSD